MRVPCFDLKNLRWPRRRRSIYVDGSSYVEWILATSVLLLCVSAFLRITLVLLGKL